MKYNSLDIDRISRHLTKQIEEQLLKCGCFYRIFVRGKTNDSVIKKLEALNEDGSPKYDGVTKFLRDMIGIRINLYFVEDLEIFTGYFKNLFSSQFVEETIDTNMTTEFKPTRVNLIFKIPSELSNEFDEVVKDRRIDSTFELQLRTVFSEGWHEVEHDLRYKCRSDWDNYQDLSRTFNGILAALETHEWSMIQVFERLAYLHYKRDNLSAMIRTKLRIRFTTMAIDKRLAGLIGEDFKKNFFKVDRTRVLNLILYNDIFFPLSIDNVIFLVNYFLLRDKKVLQNTPVLLTEEFEKFRFT